MIISATGTSGAGAQAAAAAAAAAALLGSAAPPAGSLYPGTVILTTTEDSGPDASGNYVDGRTVTFQIVTGDVASVWLPYSSLNAANVAVAVNALAEQMAAIWALNNPGT
jgi:hypothetical protein